MRPAVVAAVGVGLALLAVVARAGQQRVPEFTAEELMQFLDADGLLMTPEGVKPAVNDGYNGGFDYEMAGGLAGASRGLRGLGNSGFDFGAWQTEYEYWTPDYGGWQENTGYTPGLPYPQTPEIPNMPTSAISEHDLVALVADHLETAEGFRDTIYDDWNGKPWNVSRVGKPTIGFGHLVTKDDFARYGEAWRLQDYTEARSLLESDVRKHLRPVIPVVKVPLSVEQWVAIASLAFNAGAAGVAKSKFIRAVNEGDLNRAEYEFKDWNKVTVKRDGEPVKIVSRGLVNRREKEWTLFMTPAQTVAIAGQNYG
jgi:GH24 family phage-related lysozyme (muramidase)